MADANGKWEPLTWRDKAGLIMVVLVAVAVFTGIVTLGCYWVGKYRTPLERKVEKQVAWAQFTFDYSTSEWCVNAQRRDALPGEYIGGCWKTLHEAEEGILK
jgi:hypothetical protein